MSESLEPERVALADVKIWLRESVALLRRKYWLYLPFSLAFFLAAHKLEMFSYLTFFAGLILCQAVLVITIEIASASDQSQPVSSLLSGTAKQRHYYFAVVCFLCADVGCCGQGRVVSDCR